MRILQLKRNHSHDIYIAVFERAKKVDADLVCLQEPYVGRGVTSHPAYEIRWGMIGERKQQQVVIEILVTPQNRIIVEARTDIINHSYIQALNIWELEERRGKKKSSMGVLNVYDNHLQTDQAWTAVGSNTRRRALVDMDWDNIIRGRVVVMGDFNAHSLE